MEEPYGQGSWDFQKMCESAEMLKQRCRDVAIRVERLASSRRLVHPNIVSFPQLRGAKNTAQHYCSCYSVLRLIAH